MTIHEVKKQIGVENLVFRGTTNQDGLPTSWLRAWDNELRIEVILHEDYLDIVRNSDKLSLKKETRVGKQGAYSKYTIVIYKDDNCVISL